MFASMRKALLLCLMTIGMQSFAAPVYDLSPEVATSVASSSVRDRDSANKALGNDISGQNADFLKKLSSGLIYVDPDSGEIYVRQSRSSDIYTKVSDGSQMQAPQGLRRSAVSTRQRKAINGYLRSLQLCSARNLRI